MKRRHKDKTGGKQDVQKTERQKGLHPRRADRRPGHPAILAALLIPALTGYIDKANQEKVIAETRQVTMAAQSVLSEAYGKAEISTSTTKDDLTKYMDSIKKLAEIDGKDWTVAVTVSKTEGEVGQVKTLSLWDGSYGCVYSDGQYYVKSTDKVTVPTTNVTEEINWAA